MGERKKVPLRARVTKYLLDDPSLLTPSLRDFKERIPSKTPHAYTRETYSFIEAGGMHYLCLGDKPQGVEPGFLAIRLDHAFAEALIKNKNRLLLLQNEILPKDFVWHKDKDVLLKTLMEAIQTESGLAKKLTDFINAKHDPPLPHPFTIWMFKQDYHDPDRKDRVGITQKRYAKLHQGREMPRLKTARKKRKYQCHSRMHSQ